MPIRKTRRAWNEPGHAHFFTYSCFRRLPLLTRPRARAWVIDAIGRARCTQDVAIWGYVIMPEHVHVLLCPLRWTHAMRTILSALKRSMAQAARAWLVQTGALDWLERLTVRYPGREVFRFWKPGGRYDHNIVEERSVPTILEYMHVNPLRRELVKTPTEWEWSGARFWEGRAKRAAIDGRSGHDDGSRRDDYTADTAVAPRGSLGSATRPLIISIECYPMIKKLIRWLRWRRIVVIEDALTERAQQKNPCEAFTCLHLLDALKYDGRYLRFVTDKGSGEVRAFFYGVISESEGEEEKHDSLPPSRLPPDILGGPPVVYP